MRTGSDSLNERNIKLSTRLNAPTNYTIEDIVHYYSECSYPQKKEEKENAMDTNTTEKTDQEVVWDNGQTFDGTDTPRENQEVQEFVQDEQDDNKSSDDLMQLDEQAF